jgi:hypothetical protein
MYTAEIGYVRFLITETTAESTLNSQVMSTPIGLQ